MPNGTLEAERKPQDSRFGYALAALPDLNHDGFNDVAVGAPLEDGHRGAVYLYYGARGTVLPTYKQVRSWGRVHGCVNPSSCASCKPRSGSGIMLGPAVNNRLCLHHTGWATSPARQQLQVPSSQRLSRTPSVILPSWAKEKLRHRVEQ